ncbi:hypothetical protein L7F22_065285 [Adiantum nelumboides]|nr:hypothetical protein [Adiantum nelumboides]
MKSRFKHVLQKQKTQAMQDAELWHARFEHVGYGSLMTLQRHNMVHDLSLLEMPPRHVCEGCVLGKMHRFAFSQDGSVRATRKLQLVHSDLRGKLDDKAVKCIFVGYSSGSKGYRLYNPATNKIFESRDVIFAETIAHPMVAFDVPHMQTQDVFEGFLPSFVENQESQHVDNFDQSFDQHVTPHDVEEIVREEQEVLREERTLPKWVPLIFPRGDMSGKHSSMQLLGYSDSDWVFFPRGDMYGKHSSMQLLGYNDSDWAGDFDTRHSTSGNYCFFLGNACISWLSKKQPTMATSTCEAEYRTAFTATVDCVWIRRLLADLCECQQAPTTIFTDSQSAMAVARNPVFHARTKHIEVHYHYVRERLHAGEITLTYCPAQDNIADLFTKALSREKFEAFRKALGLLSYTG